MSRYVLSGNVRRVGKSLLQQRSNRFLDLQNSRATEVGTHYSPGRLFLCYGSSLRQGSPFLLHKVKHNLLNGRNFQNFCGLSANKKICHHSLISFKRFSQLCSYRGSALPPVGHIFRSLSLALTRSNLVVPGIMTFLIGESAWMKRTWAGAEIHTEKAIKRLCFGLAMSFIVLVILESITLLSRVIYLAILFTPCIAMAPFVKSCGNSFRKKWLHLIHKTLQKAGPAFIKWGQWAATRPDLFPRDLCSELAEFHTKAPAHSFSYTKESIEDAFKRKLPEIFERFDEEPVASGSIAQIHQATLKYRYPGQQIIEPIEVAVKVRHPGVTNAIRRDMEIMKLVARISRFIPSLEWLKLDESLQQFSIFMMDQVDLSKEAAHLNRFLYNFRKSGDVSFPRPLYPLVHPSVLVETFEHGENVMHYVDELEGHKQIKTALAHIGSHALLKMLLEDNFVHADLHPGNILVRVTNSKPFQPRPHLVLLDAGMTAELCKKDRVNLIEFFKAVALQDGRSAAECTLRFSGQQNCPNPGGFVEDVEKSFELWGSLEGSLMHATDCIQQLLEQVRRHKVNIDGSVCAVIVTTMVLEGWQRKLDPEYNVLHTLQTLLFKADCAESLFDTIGAVSAP